VAEILSEGVRLTVMGMTVVFVLLSLLVLAVKGMSRLATAIDGPPEVPMPRVDQTELIAVVTAAVHAYRKG
jgi:sodium pump decarboxylase gamma subunit